VYAKTLTEARVSAEKLSGLWNRLGRLLLKAFEELLLLLTEFFK
jgi:hypothetical protein